MIAQQLPGSQQNGTQHRIATFSTESLERYSYGSSCPSMKDDDDVLWFKGSEPTDL